MKWLKSIFKNPNPFRGCFIEGSPGTGMSVAKTENIFYFDDSPTIQLRTVDELQKTWENLQKSGNLLGMSKDFRPDTEHGEPFFGKTE